MLKIRKIGNMLIFFQLATQGNVKYVLPPKRKHLTPVLRLTQYLYQITNDSGKHKHFDYGHLQVAPHQAGSLRVEMIWGSVPTVLGVLKGHSHFLGAAGEVQTAVALYSWNNSGRAKAWLPPPTQPSPAQLFLLFCDTKIGSHFSWKLLLFRSLKTELFFEKPFWNWNRKSF